MKASDLAEILLEHPEWEVSVSVDVYCWDNNWQRRNFGEVMEVMNTTGSFVILCKGQTNDSLLW